MILKNFLWATGVTLTLLAVGIAIVIFVRGQGPSLTELMWLAIALLIASRETRV